MKRTTLLCIAYVIYHGLLILQTGLHEGMTWHQVSLLIVSVLLAGIGALFGFLQDPKAGDVPPLPGQPIPPPAFISGLAQKPTSLPAPVAKEPEAAPIVAATNQPIPTV